MPFEVIATFEERLWNRILKDGPNGCWLWQGKPSAYGYGVISEGGHHGRTLKVHRVVYELLKGPIPDGYQIDHLCRNRLCANPDHLECVKSRTNSLRSPITLAAINAAKTHCPKGHTYDYVYKGLRHCRTCRREWKRLRRARLRKSTDRHPNLNVAATDGLS